MEMKECCKTCAYYADLLKYEYLESGEVRHLKQQGFACIGLIREGVVIWNVGRNPAQGLCEMYYPGGEPK